MFFWIRFLLMLRLTEMFGPMIQILIYIMEDMVVFFGILIIDIFAFAAVGLLLFAELNTYDNMTDACLYVFESTLG